ncbi:hypothetical protein [Burkholderia gladioli]|uniref:hypothetical protein n=1 Tax=Burkholderia gladioli TaxID=28095 RepID=UPI0016406E2A|nr:hypothetical protein [Burkholderia gladioli]
MNEDEKLVQELTTLLVAGNKPEANARLKAYAEQHQLEEWQALFIAATANDRAHAISCKKP